MLIRSLASILIVASSFVLATGQTPGAQKTVPDKAAKTAGGIQTEKLRDTPFPAGVNLQFLVKELARDVDMNVLFDPESRLENRSTRIELKNVSGAEAINYILLQEGLISEEVGPRTILVSSRLRATSIPRIGVGITPLTQQLAQYFGVESGILINDVRPDTPGSKAGLKAGDVIVGIDGEPFRAGFGLMQVLNEKKESEYTLKIVRDRKNQAVNIILNNTSP